jgi:rhodanese-related sulfurtransferase
MQTTIPSVTVEELANWLALARPVRVLDVRRAPAFEKNPKMIPGAQRVFPDQVELWLAAQEVVSTPIVAYCVYGHAKGYAACSRCRMGCDSRYSSHADEDPQGRGSFST